MAKLSEFVAKYLFALFYQFLITSMRVNTCNTIFNVDTTFTKAAVKLLNALHCVWRTQMSHTKKIHLMFHFSPGIGLSDLASITKCITHFFKLNIWSQLTIFHFSVDIFEKCLNICPHQCLPNPPNCHSTASSEMILRFNIADADDYYV